MDHYWTQRYTPPAIGIESATNDIRNETVNSQSTNKDADIELSTHITNSQSKTK